ncbi:HNH endonuclease [Pectobacterium versatile]|uniref:HNH endonuclease n=1 Tax=Pectobacterium versatile TaxID=2488639 RepID=UPI000D49584B|nr:HNH endonuclease [Pectobacterium versatile]POY55702.1 HNH endonuclease [Pectobacterium versatile]
MALNKKQRAELRMKFGGRCAYCGCELPDRWHADHVQPVIRISEIVRTNSGPFTHKYVATGESRRPENDTIDNLFPTCPPCNIFKSSFDIEEFRSELQQQLTRLKSKSVNYRMSEKFGQVIETPSPIVFWFEKYQTETCNMTDLLSKERLEDDFPAALEGCKTTRNNA